MSSFQDKLRQEFSKPVQDTPVETAQSTPAPVKQPTPISEFQRKLAAEFNPQPVPQPVPQEQPTKTQTPVDLSPVKPTYTDGDHNPTPHQSLREMGYSTAPTGDGENAKDPADRNKFANTMKAGVADIIATPFMIPALGAMAGAGINSIGEDTFTESMLSDEGRLVVAELEAMPPSIERDALVADFQANPVKYMNRATRFSDAVQQYLYDTFGVIRDEDGTLSLEEEMGSVAVGAAATLPLSVVRAPAIATQVGKILVTNSLKNGITRKALKTAEILTPITIIPEGATTKQVAAQVATNFTVGAGITEIANNITDDDSYLKRFSTLDNPEVDNEGMDTESLLGTPLLAGGATAATMLGISAIVKPRLAGKQIADNIKLSPGGTPPASKIVGGQVGPIGDDGVYSATKQVSQFALDDKAPIKEAALRVGLSETKAQELDDIARAGSEQATNVQLDALYNRGQYDVEGQVIGIPKATVNKSWSDLSKANYELAERGYSAGNELALRSMGHPKSQEWISDIQLRDMVIKAERVPEVNNAMKQMREFYRNSSDKRYADGRISIHQRDLEKRMPYYMPNYPVDHTATTIGRVKSKLFTKPHISDSIEASSSRQRQSGGKDLKMSVLQSSEKYAREDVLEGSLNRTQHMILSTLNKMTVKGKSHSTVRKLRKDQTAPSGTVAVMSTKKDGEKVRWAIGDASLHTALSDRPRSVITAFNAVRKFKQMFTTGTFAPWFAPVAAGYEHTINFATPNLKMTQGYLDAGMRNAMDKANIPQSLQYAVRANPVTRIADAAVNLVDGTAQGMRGRMAQLAAERGMQMAYGTGKQADIRSATKELNDFFDSVYGQMLRGGHSGSTFSDDLAGFNPQDTAIGKRIANSIGVRVYTGLLDSLRESSRYALFARNYARAQKQYGTHLTREQVESITGEVRKTGADISRKSGFDSVNKVASTTLYGNVIMQSMGHLVHHTMNNPATWATMATLASAALMNERTMSPEGRKYVAQEMPVWKRMNSIHIELNRAAGEAFDPQEHMASIPITPEVGFLVHVTKGFMEDMFTTTGMLPKDDYDLKGQNTLLQAVGDFASFSTPVLFDIGANAVGNSNLEMGRLFRGENPFYQGVDVGTEIDRRGEGSNAGAITDRVAGTINAAMGTGGRILTEILETYVDHPQGISSSAWNDAMDIAFYEAVERQPVGKLFTNATVLTPRTTGLSKRAVSVDKQLSRLNRMKTDLLPSVSGAAPVDIRANELGLMADKRVSDRNLQRQLLDIGGYFNDPARKRDMEFIKSNKALIHKAMGTRDMPVEKRNTTIEALNRDIQDRYTRVLTGFGEFETNMARKYNMPGWNIEDFTTAVERDVNGGS